MKPIEKKTNKWNVLTYFFMGIIVLLLMVGIASECDNNGSQQQNEGLVDSAMPVENNPVAAQNPAKVEKPKVTWEERKEKDDMYGTDNIWKSITSINSVGQEFPYDETHAEITVRYMKKYGTDVIISIESGQIVGDEINGTNYIMAKFDNGSPRRYYYNTPADYSTDNVFIMKARDFIARCKKANNIILEIPIYQVGRPTFKFHVDEKLKWSK